MSAEFECAVAIPAHDALPEVIETLESALAQTLPAAEIVLVDDASTDGTGETVVARFGHAVRVLRERHGGAAAARNAAWRASSARWVAFLDADDLWRRDKLEHAVRCLSEHPGAGWFFSDGDVLQLNGRRDPSFMSDYAVIEEGWVGSPLEQLFHANIVLTSSAVVRRDLLERLGGFREDMTHTEDLELWMRLARAAPAVVSSQPLVTYRYRSGSLSSDTRRRTDGNSRLFARLGADPEVPARLRRVARRRVAINQYKLAVDAFRSGRRGQAWHDLREAWLFPERIVPPLVLAVGLLLPSAVLRWIAGQRWLVGKVVAPMARTDRVRLRGPRP